MTEVAAYVGLATKEAVAAPVEVGLPELDGLPLEPTAARIPAGVTVEESPVPSEFWYAVSDTNIATEVVCHPFCCMTG